jgi:glucokinase
MKIELERIAKQSQEIDALERALTATDESSFLEQFEAKGKVQEAVFAEQFEAKGKINPLVSVFPEQFEAKGKINPL